MIRALGPGPGAYALPPTLGYPKHDPSKHRRPQYSFGIRGKFKSHSIGPGPGAYRFENLTCYGKTKAPSYHMSGKANDQRRAIGPGPGAYDVSTCKSLESKRPPAYSIGLRTDLKNRDRIPGPNQYLFKVNLIKPVSPAYSMGTKAYLKNLSKSPGPAAYRAVDTWLINMKSPAYSISLRSKPIFQKTNVPGPSTYNLQGHKPGDKGPAYTFGTKHSQYSPPMIVPCDTPITC